MERGGERNFIAKKPCKHHFSKVIKINITSDEPFCYHVLPDMRRALHLCAMFPKNTSPKSNHEKASITTKQRDVFQNILHMGQGHKKQENTEKLFID